MVTNREKPLALYVFSNKTSDKDLFITNTTAGGVTVNDTLMHYAGRIQIKQKCCSVQIYLSFLVHIFFRKLFLALHF